MSIVLFFSLISRHVYSQQAVIATGGDISGIRGSVSFSIGQVDYIHSGTEITVWQGIQQVYDTIIAVVDTKISITIWPNPVVNRLYIKVKDENGLGITYQLFSLDGKRLEGNIVSANQIDIGMGKYAPATYILLVTHVNKKVVSFKIIKK